MTKTRNIFKLKRLLIKGLLIFLILNSTTGCQPLKNMSSNDYLIDNLQKNDFVKLNGIYQNSQDTVFGQIVHMPYRGINENIRNLIDRLFIFYPDKAYESNVTVKFEFISKRQANVSAYQNGQIFLTKKIGGKFKNGYFYVKPKMFLIPFFPVLYVHNFERVRIGKVENDIVVDHTIKMWGFALFAGGSDSGRSTSIYKTEKQ